MSDAILIFPIQLYKDINYLKNKEVYIIEEPLYFTKFKYHKLKLAYHRATMKYYYDYLIKKKINVTYIEFSMVTNRFYKKIKSKYKDIYIYDPLEHELLHNLKITFKLKLHIYSPLNFTVYEEIDIFAELADTMFKDNYTFNKFYIYYRKYFNILIDNDNMPTGGKWSFDNENRKNIPTNFNLPKLPTIVNNKYTKEAIEYINKYFSTNYGEINFIYPITHTASERWFTNFLKYKMKNFGEYEDATVDEQPFLFHSIISPMLNIGLLTDEYVISKVLKYNTKIQNKEGFIRQIFWRNYMMVVYMIEYPIITTQNINSKLYNKIWYGKTGIYPIDYMITNYIIPYAYSHHITRLMYFGNFFKLCLLKDELIYKWFMEVYIDAYSWVMYGNVYGMVLNRIKIMTKNYIASSNYIFKMSNFKNINNWKEIFDALYYNYINTNFKELKSDYGLRYQIAYWNKKNNKKEILDIATKYLMQLNK